MAYTIKTAKIIMKIYLTSLSDSSELKITRRGLKTTSQLVKKKIYYPTYQQKTIKNFELNTWCRFRFQYHKKVKTITIIKFLPFVVVVRRRREAASHDLKLASAQHIDIII